MTLEFVLSQITALIAWIFFLSSYHAKRENKIILLQIISGLFYAISYCLAGATTGLLISLFEVIIGVLYYKTDKDKYIFLCTIPIYIVIGLVSYNDGLLVLVPIFASLIDSYGLTRNNKTVVVSGLISNLLWIYYDLYYLEYVTALGDLFLVISNLSIILYGFYKYLNRKNIQITNVKELSDNDIEAVKELDDVCYDSIYRWPITKITELYLKEKDSYILIKDKNKIVGYVNFLSLKEDIYNKVLNSNEMIDSFANDDIISYKKNKHLYINMNSIVLKREYNNKKLRKRLESSIKRYINKKLSNNYKIKVIFIYTVNELEEQIVKDLGYKIVKKINNECILYSKKIGSFKLT